MYGYKAFNVDWTCRGFKYEIGKTYELPDGKELRMCGCGFHFCENLVDVFGYYPANGDTVIARVEALGHVLHKGTKYATDKIRIVQEITKDEIQDLISSGAHNAGSGNSGNYNSGNYNSGNYNSGNYNSGTGNTRNCNSGDYNTGFGNNGSCNSGDGNSGYCNTGDCNSGNHNSGRGNTGRGNTGDYNTGDFNTGSFNTGDFNTGSFNTGDFNSGLFNTDEPMMRVFNKPTNIKYTDFLRRYSDLLYRIYLKDIRDEDIEAIKKFPNFDAEIFEKTTGIKI